MTASQHIPYASPSYDYERVASDNSHLKILVICHWVWGAILAVFSLFPLIHIGLGIAMLNGAFDGDGASPELTGWLLIMAGAIAIILGESLAVLVLISAHKMSRRQARVFSIVIAAVSCLSVPLGTLLGIFTIVVLCRDGVRQQYEQAAASATRQTTFHP